MKLSGESILWEFAKQLYVKSPVFVVVLALKSLDSPQGVYFSDTRDTFFVPSGVR